MPYGPEVDLEVLATILYHQHCRVVLKQEPQPVLVEDWIPIAATALDYVTATCIRCALARQAEVDQ